MDMFKNLGIRFPGNDFEPGAQPPMIGHSLPLGGSSRWSQQQMMSTAARPPTILGGFLSPAAPQSTAKTNYS